MAEATVRPCSFDGFPVYVPAGVGSDLLSRGSCLDCALRRTWPARSRRFGVVAEKAFRDWAKRPPTGVEGATILEALIFRHRALGIINTPHLVESDFLTDHPELRSAVKTLTPTGLVDPMKSKRVLAARLERIALEVQGLQMLSVGALKRGLDRLQADLREIAAAVEKAD